MVWIICLCTILVGTVADLIPQVPSLTYHQKETVVKVFSKRKGTEAKALDEEHQHNPSHLSTMKLCIRLNTLHVSSVGRPYKHLTYGFSNCIVLVFICKFITSLIPAHLVVSVL
jgi:hypothetical protein